MKLRAGEGVPGLVLFLRLIPEVLIARIERIGRAVSIERLAVYRCMRGARLFSSQNSKCMTKVTQTCCGQVADNVRSHCRFAYPESRPSHGSLGAATFDGSSTAAHFPAGFFLSFMSGMQVYVACAELS